MLSRHTYLLRGHQVSNCDRKDFSWNRQWLQQVRGWKVSFKHSLDQDRLQLSITVSNKIETNLGMTSGSKELPKKVYKTTSSVSLMKKTDIAMHRYRFFSAAWHCPVYLLLESCISQFEFYMSLLHLVHHKTLEHWITLLERYMAHS